MYDDWPRQMRRRLRKLLGFPASHDVGILSRLLDPLREQVEERLGRKVSSAIVTFPNLVALYDEDIVDAMDYAGLTPLHTKFGGVGSQSHEASTAYAGYGLGLCSNYTDWNQCDEEEKQRPLQQVLTILSQRQPLCCTETCCAVLTSIMSQKTVLVTSTCAQIQPTTIPQTNTTGKP
jgi:hypothetical protein